MASLNQHFYGRKLLIASVVLIGVASSVRILSAGTITLGNLNSNITINPTQTGITVWGVDTSNYPDNQELLYRIGPSGTTQAWQYASSAAFNTDGGTQNNVAVISYHDATGNLTLTQIYTLLGSQPGSGSSSVSEQLQVTNSGPQVDLNLFQYNNLQLSSSSDTLQFLSPSNTAQSGPQLVGYAVANIAVTGTPTAYEAANYPTLLNALATGNPVVLNDSPGPVNGNTESAMQWDVPLGNNRSYTLGEQYSLNVVPEPSTISLLGALLTFAAVAKAWRLRGRNASNLG